MTTKSRIFLLITFILIAIITIICLPISLNKFLDSKKLSIDQDEIKSISIAKNFLQKCKNDEQEYIVIKDAKEISHIITLLSSYKIKPSTLDGLNILCDKALCKNEYGPPYYISINKKNSEPLIIYILNCKYLIIDNDVQDDYYPLKITNSKNICRDTNNYIEDLFSEYYENKCGDKQEKQCCRNKMNKQNKYVDSESIENLTNILEIFDIITKE